MIKVSICDDEKNTRLLLVSVIEKLCDKWGEEVLIREYSSTQQYLADYCGKAPTDVWEEDIMFLDIEMNNFSVSNKNDINGAENVIENGMENTMGNGMELAGWIRKSDRMNQPIIIFVTGYEKYVYDAFDVGAFGYLLKPIRKERFAGLFDRAIKQVQREKSRRKKIFLVEYKGIKKTVRMQDLVYAESRDHKIILHLSEGELEYYAKLGSLERELAGQFFRIHRSYLINLGYVDEYSKKEIIMTNGDRLCLSKNKYDSFVKAYMDFLMEK